MKREIKREIAVITRNVKRLVIICVSLDLLGALTWLTTDGIWLRWRVSVKPPLCLPLFILLLLWIIAYIAYGLMLSRECNGKAALRLVMSYMLSLFWCPLALGAGATIAAVISLSLSLFYLCLSLKDSICFSSLTVTSAIFVALLQIYSAYVTIGLL